MTAKKHTEISDAEEARIQKMIASDPDSPELTDDQIAAAKPFAEAFVAKFKATGPGWQSRINEVLRKSAAQ